MKLLVLIWFCPINVAISLGMMAYVCNPSYLKRLKQEDHEFKASLSYTVRTPPPQKTEEKKGELIQFNVILLIQNSILYNYYLLITRQVLLLLELLLQLLITNKC
jgi:hypothetical protein